MRKFQYLLLLLIMAIGAYFVTKYAIVDPEAEDARKVKQLSYIENEESEAPKTMQSELSILYAPFEGESLHLLNDISLLVIRITQFSEKIFNSQYVDPKEIISVVKMLNSTAQLAPERKDIKHNIQQYQTAIESGALEGQAPLEGDDLLNQSKESLPFYEQDVFPFYILLINDLVKDLETYNQAIDQGGNALDFLERNAAYVEDYLHDFSSIQEKNEKTTLSMLTAYELLHVYEQNPSDFETILEIKTSLLNAESSWEASEKSVRTIESNFLKNIPDPATHVRSILEARHQLKSLPEILVLCQNLAISVSESIKTYTHAAKIAKNSQIPEIFPAENLSIINKKMIEKCKILISKLNTRRVKKMMSQDDKVNLFLQQWKTYIDEKEIAMARLEFLKKELNRAEKGKYSIHKPSEKYAFPQRTKTKIKYILRIFDQSTMRPIESPKMIIENNSELDFKKIPSTSQHYVYFSPDTIPYILNIQAEGFESKTIKLNISDNTKAENIDNIYLEPIKIQEIEKRLPLSDEENVEQRLAKEQLKWRTVRYKLKNDTEKFLSAEGIHFHRINAIKSGFEPQLDYVE